MREAEVVKDMMPDIKLFLRVTNPAYDKEVEMLIYAAIADLQMTGINTDKLVETYNEPEHIRGSNMFKQAITYYSKAGFGIDNLEADKYLAIYERIRMRLGMSVIYSAVE